jgi:hypothetical protein
LVSVRLHHTPGANGADAGEKESVVKACGADYFVNFQAESDVAGAVNKISGGGAHVM